ncbi:hypothetical protein GGR57DRAFT_454648 [Xylariaceae sp. FL1272]|nr:hypothetical protein GGR57DRAFT_454648 [Xylariaceae sp. FL1272]
MQSIAVTYIFLAFLARASAGVVSPSLHPTPDVLKQQRQSNGSHLVGDQFDSNSEGGSEVSEQGFWPFPSPPDDDDDFEGDDGKWYTIEQRKVPGEIGLLRLVGHRGRTDYLESEDSTQDLPMPSLSPLNTTGEPGHDAAESTLGLTTRAKDDCSHEFPIPTCRTAYFHDPHAKSCFAVLRMLGRVQSHNKMADWPPETRSVCTDSTPLGNAPKLQCCVSWSKVKGHAVGAVEVHRIREHAKLIFEMCVNLSKKARTWGRIRGVQTHPRDPGCANICMYKRPTHCRRIHL